MLVRSQLAYLSCILTLGLPVVPLEKFRNAILKEQISARCARHKAGSNLSLSFSRSKPRLREGGFLLQSLLDQPVDGRESLDRCVRGAEEDDPVRRHAGFLRRCLGHLECGGNSHDGLRFARLENVNQFRGRVRGVRAAEVLMRKPELVHVEGTYEAAAPRR
jgi:hypothetical protein